MMVWHLICILYAILPSSQATRSALGDVASSWRLQFEGINCKSPDFSPVHGLGPSDGSHEPNIALSEAAYKVKNQMLKLAHDKNCRLCNAKFSAKPNLNNDAYLPDGPTQAMTIETNVECAPAAVRGACFSIRGHPHRRIQKLDKNDCHGCPPECDECIMQSSFFHKKLSFKCNLKDKPKDLYEPVEGFRCSMAKRKTWDRQAWKTLCSYRYKSENMAVDYQQFWLPEEQQANSPKYGKLEMWGVDCVSPIPDLSDFSISQYMGGWDDWHAVAAKKALGGLNKDKR